MSDQSDIVVKINGKAFEGWTSLEVNTGLEQFAGGFAMKYTDKYPYKPEDFSFRLGDSCTLEINNNRLITGYLEEIESSYSEIEHSLQMRGRDKTADLVDCCHWYSGYKGEFKKTTIQNIFKALCNQFGIDVVIDATATAEVANRIDFKINEGDTISDSIANLCRQYALLPVSYGDGKLTITRATTENADTNLRLGVNIKEGRLFQSNLERFSDYVVKGDDSEADWKSLTSKTQPTGSYSDSLIKRHRPIIVIAESNVTFEDAKKRAKWESDVRAAKSREFEYIVQGWLQDSGKPWRINQLVKIYDPLHGINGDTMLCTKVIFKLEENKTTTMSFVHKDAYKLLGRPEKNKTKFDLSDLTKK